jgi:preprotein translocase subunit SecE
MTKSNGGSSSPWAHLVRELVSTEIYKRSQGRLVRQITCLAIWVVFALATYRTYEYLRVMQHGMAMWLTVGLPALVLVFGLWLGFRVVNFPAFADFLIAVEAEMNKVSWPSRTELIRSSLVVIILMFGLAAVLFLYDTVLNWFLSRVLHVTIV